VPDALALAARLAEVFPETGLWPMLWEFPESPDHYLDGSGDPSAAHRVDTAAVMRRLWRLYGLPGEFPGLARPPAGSDSEVSADPFGTLERAGLGPTEAYLVLVPAHRPSEVMSVAGFGGTVVLRSEGLAAVLLSWEERFQAVPALIGPGTLTLVVGAPPESGESALRLAHEIRLTAPATVEAPARLARDLRFAAPSVALLSRNVWPLGWPD
jgi:hypothetical protein